VKEEKSGEESERVVRVDEVVDFLSLSSDPRIDLQTGINEDGLQKEAA
jgi:hypothetical protein